MQEPLRTLPASPNWYGPSTFAFSPHADDDSGGGGGLLAYASRSVVVLFSPRRCAVVSVCCGHRDRVTSVAFLSPRFLVTCAADRTVRAWDFAAGRQPTVVASHDRHGDEATALAVTADGVVVSGDRSGRVVAWVLALDTATPAAGCGPPTATASLFGGGGIGVAAIAAASSLQNIVAVAGTNGLVVIADAARGCRPLFSVSAAVDSVQCIAWLPPKPKNAGDDGQRQMLTTAAKDGRVRLWSVDVEASAVAVVCSLNLSGHQRKGKRPEEVDFSGKRERNWTTFAWVDASTLLAASGRDGHVFRWNFDAESLRLVPGAPLQKVAHNRVVFNLVGTSAGAERPLAVSYSLDRSLVLWDLDTGRPLWSACTIGGWVYSIEPSPLEHGKVLAACGDQAIRVWNVSNESNPFDCSLIWRGLQSKVTSLAAHPREPGLAAFGTEDGRVGICNTGSGTTTNLQSSHRGAVYSLSWKARGGEPPILYSCGTDGSVLIHSDPESRSKEPAQNLNALVKAKHSEASEEHLIALLGRHNSVAWNADGTLLAIGNKDGSIIVLDSDFRVVHSQKPHVKPVSRLRWCPVSGLRNFLASASDDSMVCVVDTRKGASFAQKPLSGHKGPIYDIAWEPILSGGRGVPRIASDGSDGTTLLWDLEQGVAVGVLTNQERAAVCAVSWIEPDKIYAGGSDQAVTIWAVDSAAPPTTASRKLAVPKQATQEQKPASSTATPKKPSSSSSQEHQQVLPEHLLGTFLGGELQEALVSSCIDIAKGFVPQNMRIIAGSREQTREALKDEASAATSRHAAAAISAISGDMRSFVEGSSHATPSSPLWVALSASLGREVWEAALLIYAEQQAAISPVSAALCYIALHRISDAISVFMRAKLFAEALSIAKSQLPEGDPAITRVLCAWGEYLEAKQHFLHAARCYLAAGVHSRAFDALQKMASSQDPRFALEGSLAMSQIARALDHPSSLQFTKNSGFLAHAQAHFESAALEFLGAPALRCLAVLVAFDAEFLPPGCEAAPDATILSMASRLEERLMCYGCDKATSRTLAAELQACELPDGAPLLWKHTRVAALALLLDGAVDVGAFLSGLPEEHKHLANIFPSSTAT